MRRKQDDTVRITSAARPKSEDIRSREVRYVISMGVRTLCFLLAVASIGHWFMWAFLAAGVFLPVFAVVFANAAAPPEPEPDPYDANRSFRALEQ